MSKQHFEWAAEYVRAYRQEVGMTAEMPCVPEEAFVSMFRRFGPRFDEPRFRRACRA